MRQSLTLLFAAISLLGVGCATTLDDRAPLSSYDQGGGAGMITNIISPKDGQTFPAGKDIPVTAGAMDMSGVNLCVIIVNGKQIAQDHRRPYTAVISKPNAGKYVIHSVAYNIYGDSKSSPGVVINVK